MTSGPARRLRFDGDAVRARPPARIDSTISATDAVDVHREALDRLRLDDVAQVVHEALERRQLALDGAAESVARLGVEVVAQQQARAVADVLDRVREVVDEAGGDAAEHRLALLALDVFLQLDEAIGHRVEGVAEIAELVAGRMATRVVELAGGDVLRAALERRGSGR